MGQKKERVLDVFYMLLMGQGVSVSGLADEYEVSTKSISRDINEIKNYIAEHREQLGGTELKYNASEGKYYLKTDKFFDSSELFALVKLMIGSRCLSKDETLELTNKLKQFTSKEDQQTINHLISNEMYHFNEVKHDCKSVIDNLWKLTNCIEAKREITISYYKMNRDYVERRLRPMAITFTDFYYYLIAYQQDENDADVWEVRYYRIDRIVHIVEHRTSFKVEYSKEIDEGDLMNKMQYMFPGKMRHIKFEFTGPSVQAVLDKIPTAREVEIRDEAHIIEADVLGDGVNMFLFSQGSWVKPLAPKEFVDEMREEVEKMLRLY